MKRYLMGFKCLNQPYGCDCNTDTPQGVKDKFFELRGFDYNDYCLYDISEGNTEAEALANVYACCGASDEQTIRDGFPVVEVIGEV